MQLLFSYLLHYFKLLFTYYACSYCLATCCATANLLFSYYAATVQLLFMHTCAIL